MSVAADTPPKLGTHFPTAMCRSSTARDGAARNYSERFDVTGGTIERSDQNVDQVTSPATPRSQTPSPCAEPGHIHAQPFSRDKILVECRPKGLYFGATFCDLLLVERAERSRNLPGERWQNMLRHSDFDSLRSLQSDFDSLRSLNQRDLGVVALAQYRIF